jgi:hypothetical protein
MTLAFPLLNAPNPSCEWPSDVEEPPKRAEEAHTGFEPVPPP